MNKKAALRSGLYCGNGEMQGKQTTGLLGKRSLTIISWHREAYIQLPRSRIVGSYIGFVSPFPLKVFELASAAVQTPTAFPCHPAYCFLSTGGGC
jgi:hypothetical protein